MIGVKIEEYKGALMDVSKILVELREERQQIEEAIISLERLAREGVRAAADHPRGFPASRRLNDEAVHRGVRTR